MSGTNQPNQPAIKPRFNTNNTQFQSATVIPETGQQEPTSKAPSQQLFSNAPAPTTAVDSGPIPQAPTGFQPTVAPRDPSGVLNPNTGLREMGGPLPGTRAFAQEQRIRSMEDFLKGKA